MRGGKRRKEEKDGIKYEEKWGGRKKKLKRGEREEERERG